MMSIELLNGDICIDHGDADISAGVFKGAIEIGIGEDFTGSHRPEKPQGYARYLEFKLSYEEALALADWIRLALEDGRVTYVGP